MPVARIVRIDACGIQCPGPILKLKTSMEQLQSGECLEIRATDAGFPRDAEAWCRMTGNRFVSAQTENGTYIVRVEKATPCAMEVSHPVSTAKSKTFILFSDDLDKVLATFVLANGAAATGEKVTIFFTFWGLNAIKKTEKPKVRKDWFGTEICRGLINYAFASLKAKCVLARMYASNKASVRLCEKCGMQKWNSGITENGKEFHEYRCYKI